jgi:hypothetical protein
MSRYAPLDFGKFGRSCPVCGGCVYRDFTLLEKISLFLPFHLVLKAKHHCDSCGRRFTSARNATDFVFVILFGSATYLLGEDWVASLIVLAIWLLVSLIKPRGPVGPSHTFIAAVILSTLWFFVFALKARPSPEFMSEHGATLFTLFVVVGFLFSFGMLYLDRMTYGRLTPVQQRF